MLTRNHTVLSYLPPTRASTSEMYHTCLYSATAERHCTLSGTHFPSRWGYAELAWLRPSPSPVQGTSGPDIGQRLWRRWSFVTVLLFCCLLRGLTRKLWMNSDDILERGAFWYRDCLFFYNLRIIVKISWTLTVDWLIMCCRPRLELTLVVSGPRYMQDAVGLYHS